MTPVVFDGCFGWLHPAAGRRGVVLCSPHGNEDLCVYRTWRTLAERLAAAGLPTLRFDYPGTGNSAGSDEDPELVRAWLDGIHAAVRWLRANTGVEEVALVGLRLGATLAAMAAAERGGVERLVLMAPCASGKAYAHEVKAMARMAGTPQTQPDGVEFAGFLLTAETLVGLRALDLAALPAAPAARVLLLNRTDARDAAHLGDRLRALGAEVEEQPFTDLASLMNSVHRAVLPDTPLDRVTAWLSADAPMGEAAVLPALAAARLEVPGAVETPVRFGSGGSLAGVLCEPAVRTGADRPTLLLLNSGATHHVGSGRMSVTLARRLAARGYASLRMDVAGLGDSAPRAGRCDNLIYCKDACDDTRAALDWLDGQGYARIVTVGLCSGATLALHTALGDRRVVGQVMVNPGRFVLGNGETSEAVILAAAKRTRDYVQMVADPRAWRAMLRSDRKAMQVARTLTARALDSLRAMVLRLRDRNLGADPATGDVAQWFRRLSERGVDTLLLYSADDVTLGELESRLGRGGKRLRGLAALRLEILEDADHSLMRRAAQEHFAALLEAHLVKAFPAEPERRRRPEPAEPPARIGWGGASAK